MPEVSLFSESTLSKSAPTFQKLLYSRKESAFALSISVRNLDMILASGGMKVRKIGGRILIPYDALLRFASRDHARLTPHESAGSPA